MINSWEHKSVAIVEADDFQDRYDRNGLNYLFWWKSKYPDFKITLFTIPDRTSPELMYQINNLDWIEIAVHGWNHESNFECYGWNYDKAIRFLSRTESVGWYKKIFKAPGWTITPDYNGYPSTEKNLIHEDKQAIYKALRDLDYIIFDRHYNAPARPEGCKVVCVDDQPKIVHMHTWNMEVGDDKQRNGFGQVEEEHGVPWDNNTEFHFVSEAWEKGLFEPCKS